MNRKTEMAAPPSGPLIPDHYKVEEVTDLDLKVMTLLWGFMLGFGWLTANKAIRQSLKIWRRSRRITIYMCLMWIEWWSCAIMGLLCWLFVNGNIGPSFTYFFVILVLWTLQIQCILQIILNRLSILMSNEVHAHRLKWYVAGIITVINVAVFVIWIPARLQISPTWIRINEIWDRSEKAVFALVDCSLNVYFIVLVRQNLLAKGLHHYQPLFRFNLIMIFISVSLDFINIGAMSFGNTHLYVQFQALMYVVKLHIELDMASLITKVARNANGCRADYCRNYHRGTALDNLGRSQTNQSKPLSAAGRVCKTTEVEQDSTEVEQDSIDMPFCDRGITGTVETTMDEEMRGRLEDEITVSQKCQSQSRSSSRRGLTSNFHAS